MESLENARLKIRGFNRAANALLDTALDLGCRANRQYATFDDLLEALRSVVPSLHESASILLKATLVSHPLEAFAPFPDGFPFDARLRFVLHSANEERIQAGHSTVTPRHILLASLAALGIPSETLSEIRASSHA